MSKIFHTLFAILWTQVMMLSIDAIQYSAHGPAWVHITLLAWATFCGGLQVFSLFEEAKGEL
jgi:hypothetical protein